MKIALYAVIAFCLSCCGSARAMNLYTYDLDSLAYMSSDVVEADIVGSKPNKNFEIVQVRVTDVRKGHFTKGQTVDLIALSFFYKTGADTFNSKPLAAGDHLFLWLVKATKTFLYDIP